MDAEISELGPGVESADCPVWRTAYQLSVRKEKQEWICPKAGHSHFLSIPSAFVLLPEFPCPIPEAGCGQRPRKEQSIQCLICHAKKTKRMYKILSDGYTVNRKIDSTAKTYISISYQKDSLSKDTRFFTASLLYKQRRQIINNLLIICRLFILNYFTTMLMPLQADFLL